MARRDDGLVEALRRVLGRGRPQRPPPQGGLEARLQALEREVQEVRGRVNSLFFLVMGALVVEVVVRLLR